MMTTKIQQQITKCWIMMYYCIRAYICKRGKARYINYRILLLLQIIVSAALLYKVLVYNEDETITTTTTTATIITISATKIESTTIREMIS